MAMTFTGSFFDGRSSRPHAVRVMLDAAAGTLKVEGETIEVQHFPLAEVTIAPRVGDTARFLYLSEGGKEGRFLDYFSTHPNSRERAERIKKGLQP